MNDYQHPDGGILKIWPSSDGTLLAFEDDNRVVRLYNPINDQLVSFPSFNTRVEQVLWDSAEANLMAALEGGHLHVCVHTPASISGPAVEAIGVFPSPRIDAVHAHCLYWILWLPKSCRH